MRKLNLEELGRLDQEEYLKAPKIPVVVILDNIRSALNVGSFFRTADAFRIQKIYCLGITAQPPHREILKTAIGATQTVSWEYLKNGVDLVKSLQEEGYKVCAVEQADQSCLLKDFQLESAGKYAIVFGNEVGGVSQEIFEMADEVIEIQQFGTKHSLNVAVCGGIVLWHFSKAYERDL